jgi:transcriptional regulator with XRE-family HTH domain
MLTAARRHREKYTATYSGLVGLVVAYVRRGKNFSQNELAKRSGVSQPTISRIEKGEADITMPQMAAIAAALSTTPGVIIDVADKLRAELERESVVVASTAPHKRPTERGWQMRSLTGAVLAFEPLGLVMGGAIERLLLARKSRDR